MQSNTLTHGRVRERREKREERREKREERREKREERREKREERRERWNVARLDGAFKYLVPSTWPLTPFLVPSYFS